MLKRSVFGIWVILIFAVHQYGCIFRMTNVMCNSTDLEFARIQNCRIKAVRRHTSAFYLHVNLLKVPVTNCLIHIELLKRTNGFKPFLINKTWDMCAYLAKRNRVDYLGIIYNIFKDYTNMNHSCPYNHDIILDGFIPFHSNMPLPWPTGEYQLKTAWIINNITYINVDGYFEFVEENMFSLKGKPKPKT